MGPLLIIVGGGEIPLGWWHYCCTSFGLTCWPFSLPAYTHRPLIFLQCTFTICYSSVNVITVCIPVWTLSKDMKSLNPRPQCLVLCALSSHSPLRAEDEGTQKGWTGGSSLWPLVSLSLTSPAKCWADQTMLQLHFIQRCLRCHNHVSGRCLSLNH